jgi:thioesterase domain-containing protein
MTSDPLVRQRLAAARAHFTAMSQFHPAPLHAAVHWLRASGTRAFAATARDAYARAGAPLTERELAGDHRSILEPPHVRALATAIHAALHAPASEASRGDAP